MSFSIATNLLANEATLRLDRHQAALKSDVTKLSSGLRINTASDDPSGLAIAEKLGAQVSGFEQASRNVQDASNAATLAEGALQTVADILQRIRSLSVEASNDITSPTDKANLQAEVAQLLQEVNRIAQNTQFNGVPLLDGSHAGFQPGQPPAITIESNAALASSGPGFIIEPVGTIIPPSVSDNDFATVPPIPPGTVGAATGLTSWSTNRLGSPPEVYNSAVPTNVPPLPAPPSASNQALLLNGTGQLVKQTITGLQSGGGYTFTFSAASAGANGGETLDVIVDGVPVGSYIPGPAFSTFTVPQIIAAGTTSTVEFIYSGPTNSSFAVTNVGVTQTQFVGNPVALNTGLLVATAIAANSSFFTSAGGTQGLGGTGTTDGTIELQVVNTGASIAAQETYYDSATGLVSVSPILLSSLTFANLFDNVSIATGAFTAADVGVTSYVRITQNVASQSNPNNPALTIHDGANEGATLQIGLTAVNTSALRISSINLLLSAASSPSIGAEDAIGNIDFALTNLLYQRAQLGSIVVRLNASLNNNAIAAVNLQASESDVRDLDVGRGTTEFTRDQILVNVGTSVLAQANSTAQLVTKLFQ